MSASNILRALCPPRLRIANTPTPVIELKRISRELPIRLSVKRDDETSCLLSGNKIRKLEFLLAEAMHMNATHILSCGGIQSNHARATAIAAKQMGLECVLFLRRPDEKAMNADGTPKHKDGNLFLDLLSGSDIKLVDPADFQNVNEIMENESVRLRKQGHVPYCIPLGGSNGLGCWGYIEMMTELLDSQDCVPFSHILVPVGSGGTIAGLLIARTMLKLKHLKIIGVVVSDDCSYFRRVIQGLVSEFNSRFGTNIDVGDYELYDNYIGEGYAIPYEEQFAEMRKLARLEGLVLDPAYNGKAWYGLLDLVKQKKFTNDDHLLFIHTGGVFGLMHKFDNGLSIVDS